MKTRTTTMKLIAAVAIAIAAPQTSYTQHTRPQDVNVVNTPNVNALQGGAWSVGINPSSNTVLVASSSREPVFTTQTLHVANIFQKPIEIDLVEGQVLGYASFTVPAGKLLVIEEVFPLYEIENTFRPVRKKQTRRTDVTTSKGKNYENTNLINPQHVHRGVPHSRRDAGASHYHL